MSIEPEHIQSQFGGQFLTPVNELREKLSHVKAFVFDWDGVFNDGVKDAEGSSSFSEVDSMGINMLRFNHYLHTGNTPITIIISGEKNKASFTFAKRESLHVAYYKIGNKAEALEHLCNTHKIEAKEIAFFFDDILDISVAAKCGLRIMTGRKSNPLFSNLVEKNKLADYITEHDGKHHGVREATELLIGLNGQYDDTIMQRANYTAAYQSYLQMRNSVSPSFYTSIESKITEQNPQ